MDKKPFALGFRNEWKGGNFHILEISIHRCPYCQTFQLGIAGFGISIGTITLREGDMELYQDLREENE